MAKKDKEDKRKKKITIDPNLVDYYAVYGLDRNAERTVILKQLRSIQGQIRQKKSGGALNSEEVMAKLLEQEEMIVAAVRVFKTDERRAEYDEMLQAAIESGTLNTEAQKVAEDTFAEIEQMFLRGNYEGVIRRCRQVINDHSSDKRVYSYLAQSYGITGDVANAVKTAEDNIRLHPNDLDALDLGARIVYAGTGNFEKAQGYVNQMLEIDSDSGISVGAQVYLHLSEGQDDAAFSMLENYVSAHPSDEAFRRSAAYDVIGAAQSGYTEYDVEGSTVYLFAKKEDYERYLMLSQKAVSIYDDENTQRSLALAKAYGEIEFNEDNKQNIKWCWIAGVVYLLPIVQYVLMGPSGSESGSIGSFILRSIPFIILAGLMVFVAIQLTNVSKRPLWQVVRYYLTGEREPKERIFVTIGAILGGWMRWSWKLAWKIFEFAINMI